MPPSDYGSDGRISTMAEHLLPPVFTYLVRKLNLAVVVGLLFAARQLSRPYGFEFSGEVSDRDSWKWELQEKLPLYRARVEKVD